jgi:queuosine precursor transporter
MDQHIISILSLLHRLPGDVVSLMVLLISLGLLFIAWRGLGLLGLYAFQMVVLIAANIQVLRMGSTLLSPEPIALGTVIFSTTYIAQDLINQNYGSLAAKRGIWVGFLAQLIFTIVMLTSLAYSPLSEDGAYEAMSLLFIPSLRIMASSLCAYWISQTLNVRLFPYLQLRLTRYPLWISVSISAWAATFIDHFVFSFAAWKILSVSPVTWRVLWYSYLFPSLIPRLIIAFFISPMIYINNRVHVQHEQI